MRGIGSSDTTSPAVPGSRRCAIEFAPSPAWPPVSDRRKVLPQYVLPKRGLTAFAGRVASRERGATTTRLVRWFVRKYGVDMSEAADPDIAAYASFNDFFTRALKARRAAHRRRRPGLPGRRHDQPVRPHRAATRSCRPRAIATRPRRWSAATRRWPQRFHDGSFATLYLSPKDYHRIHMPCDGTLMRMIHVPGALFSVNPLTARGVPGLFARNERVVCVFESAAVGTLRAGAGRRDHRRQHGDGLARRRQRAARAARARVALRRRQRPLAQGEEMGRFLLGSTVVMLFEKAAAVRFEPAWLPGRTIRLGEAMADAR